ncbi:helix-turn-helix domain-containing protein [Sphingobacterium faecale]|uniref:Helix-turn-helix domain-containing protein n=1 Tax=Sphingobacterium faecale TaxID=2803775 RepID=A0ABS1R1J5_9SPHI|nr:helix-turn-helix domain-containing protein [Sphingobacterium faecale]MBL1408175.1 helix-turn-helix domain-containing protein [Sphingobacterium faecale]
MKPIQFTVSVYGEGVFAVMEDKKENFYNYYHRHDEAQITYILKGKGTIMVGNIMQSFQSGDIFVLKPNEPHMFDRDMEDEEEIGDIHAIHIFVNLERMKKLYHIPDFELVKEYLLELDTSKMVDRGLSESMMHYFTNLMVKTSMPRFTEFLSLLYTLAIHRSDASSLYSGVRTVAYSDKDGARISQVYKYTFDHYNEDITVDQVASIVHMTPTSFCKFFKKHTTKTYISFLNEVRIEKACQILIDNKSEHIAEAAFQSGFNNVVHFNRVFKSITKMSPRRYIAQHSMDL